LAERKPPLGFVLLLACKVLVEDALGGLQGGVSRDGDVGCDAGALPGRPAGGVGVHGGDAEEDAGLANGEGLGRVGSPGGGLPDDHGAAELLHDVDELLCGAGGRSAGQHDQAFLGAVPRA